MYRIKVAQHSCDVMDCSFSRVKLAARARKHAHEHNREGLRTMLVVLFLFLYACLLSTVFQGLLSAMSAVYVRRRFRRRSVLNLPRIRAKVVVSDPNAGDRCQSCQQYVR